MAEGRIREETRRLRMDNFYLTTWRYWLHRYGRLLPPHKIAGHSDPERETYMLRQTMRRNVAPTCVKRLFADFLVFSFWNATVRFFAARAEMKILQALIWMHDMSMTRWQNIRHRVGRSNVRRDLASPWP